MDLRKILATAVFGILAGCTSIRADNLFDEFLFLKVYTGKTITIGQDTDKDLYEDRVECYEIKKIDEGGVVNLELTKVYEDTDRNYNIEENELVWEKDKEQEYDGRKKLLFLKRYDNETDIFFSVGYDTDGNAEEDSKEFYQIMGTDESGHFTLKKVGADFEINRVRDV